MVITHPSSRRADESGHGHFAVLQFAEMPREANDGEKVFGRLFLNELAHVFRHEVWIGARRVVPVGSIDALLNGGAE